MGYPSSGLMEKYVRNSLDDVLRFLAKQHKQHYKVYNLCIENERQYPATTFEKMASYGFLDHNPPSIALIHQFCEDVVAAG